MWSILEKVPLADKRMRILFLLDDPQCWVIWSVKQLIYSRVNSHSFWTNDHLFTVVWAQRFPIIYCMKPIISLNLTVFFKTQCSSMRYTLLYNWMNWLLVIEQWTSSVFVSVSFFRYKYSHILSHSPFLFTLQCHLSIFLSVHVGFYLVKWVSCNRTLLNLVF